HDLVSRSLVGKLLSRNWAYWVLPGVDFLKRDLCVLMENLWRKNHTHENVICAALGSLWLLLNIVNYRGEDHIIPMLDVLDSVAADHKEYQNDPDFRTFINNINESRRSDDTMTQKMVHIEELSRYLLWKSGLGHLAYCKRWISGQTRRI